MPDDAYHAIQMKRRCRTCQGEGVVEDHHCQLCQQRIAAEDDWWHSDDDVLPCGHGQANLVETVTCPACGGAGQVEQWLTPAEVAAIRRGRIARIVFVVGALIILFTILAIVAMGPNETAPVCGYWWYGIPALLLATRYLPAN